MKKLCDSLTLFRLFAALSLIAIGFFGGAAVSRAAIIILILGRVSDILDGRIARATKKPETRIGRHEVIFDAFLSLGAIIYLGASDLLNGYFVSAWALWLIFVMACPLIPYNLFWFFEALSSAFTLPLLIILSKDWLMLLIFCFCGIIALFWDWQRAKEHMIAWKIIFQNNYHRFKN